MGRSDALSTPALTFGMTVLLAVAAGTCVGNLYWAQPLLAQIAASFGVPVTAAGALVTLTQVGYVLGILFLVPTGDILNRRRLIPAVMALGVAALLLCAASPSLPVLAGSLVLLGATTVSGQIVIPLVSDLASDETRGFSVGLVALMGERTILAVVAAAVLFGVGSQGVSVLDQARLFSLDPAARSRLNTVFVVNNFICGAVGSALASLLWGAGGWAFVVAGGCAWVVLALAVWFSSQDILAHH